MIPYFLSLGQESQLVFLWWGIGFVSDLSWILVEIFYQQDGTKWKRVHVRKAQFAVRKAQFAVSKAQFAVRKAHFAVREALWALRKANCKEVLRQTTYLISMILVLRLTATAPSASKQGKPVIGQPLKGWLAPLIAPELRLFNLSRKARLSRVHLEEVELAKGVRGD